MMATATQDEDRYRHAVLRLLVLWSLVVTAVLTAVNIVVYTRRPTEPMLALLLDYGAGTLVCLGCLVLIRRGAVRLATRCYLGGATLIVGISVLYAPASLVVLGMMGFMLFVRITMLLEGARAARVLGVLAAGLYLVLLALRALLALPTADLGDLELLLVYVLPVLVLVMFSLLDQRGTRHLRDVLARSEAARHALEATNAELERRQRQLQRSERRLARSNQELQQLNDELKNFTYLISHDLRAPLVNLKGFAAELRLALDALAPAVEAGTPALDARASEAARLALADDVPEALGFIEASTRRMERLIDAVLQLSRLGRRPLEPTTLDVNALVAEVLTSFRHLIEARGVAVVVEPLPEVVADRLSMEQIFSNLVSNALNYLEAERPGRVEIGGKRGLYESIFYVRDNGQGIAADETDKVFLPFRRLGRPEVPGEGMGLSYVQTLVRRLGGRIWCESEPGRGTTFTFTLQAPAEEDFAHG